MVSDNVQSHKASLKKLIPTFLLLVLGVFAVHAVLNLVLTIPSVVITPTAIASSVCNGTLVEIGNPPPTSTGILRFACPSAGAFTVSAAGIATPTLTLPTGYTGIGFTVHSSPDCNTFTNLISGTSMNLSPVGDYDFCASYDTPGGTLSSFTVTFSS